MFVLIFTQSVRNVSIIIVEFIIIMFATLERLALHKVELIRIIIILA